MYRENKRRYSLGVNAVWLTRIAMARFDVNKKKKCLLLKRYLGTKIISKMKITIQI